jgi:hypothetical protein
MKRLTAYLLAISAVFLPLLALALWISPRLVLPLLIVLTGWFVWGAKIVSHRGLSVPQPAEDRIDVGNALRALWWAAWWPRYL